MAISTKVSKTGMWLLLGVLGAAGAQSVACTAPFHSCQELRNCRKEPSADAGAAGEGTMGGAAGGTVEGAAGEAGTGGNVGTAGEGTEPSAGSSGVGGDSPCSNEEYDDGTSCRKLTPCGADEYE